MGYTAHTGYGLYIGTHVYIYIYIYISVVNDAEFVDADPDFWLLMPSREYQFWIKNEPSRV